MNVSVQAIKDSKNEELNDKVFNLLFESDELNWKDIINELIRTENMDPWDVNISVIADRFLHVLKDMKEFDFRISGKIVLAAAFFLKIKSDRLIGEDLLVLDSLMDDSEPFDEFFDILDDMESNHGFVAEEPSLTTRTPQPRKRKVSVDDLVGALEKALALEKRRSFKRSLDKKNKEETNKLERPKDVKDISVIQTEMFEEIRLTLNKVKSVKFTQLLREESREEKVYTFRPLLHLDHDRKIELVQDTHFGEIHIELTKLAKEYEKHAN